MSLEAILQAISASGDAEVHQIEARACTQVERIQADARREAVQVKEKAFRTAVTPVARERSRIIHEAKLEMLHRVGDLRETLVDTALERARIRLADIRKEDVYPDVLHQLVQEALTELELSSGDSGKVCLEIDPRDRALIDPILSAMNLNLPIRDDLNCWGGLVARSEDGRVVVINTLEARLERATPYLRRYLAGLFEDKECRILTTATPAYAP
jgi:V/A-type H+/Na+-transporting ATPase subunit E